MNVALCAGGAHEKDGIADYARYAADGLAKQGVSVDQIPLKHHCADPDYYRAIARRANGADICHLQFNYVYFNGELPYRNRFHDFAAHLKIPFVMTIHEIRIGYGPLTSRHAGRVKRIMFNRSLFLWDEWSRRMHARIYGRPDRLILHNQPQAEVLTAFDRRLAGKIAVIPHGIPEDSRAGVSREEAQRRLGLAGKRVLTVFGFINSRKGYEQVIEVLPLLPVDTVLLIAGGMMKDNTVDKDYYDVLLRRIADAGMGRRVKITGYVPVEDIPGIMAVTDVCLAVFSSTGASGSLSRCISYCKPVVASDNAVHREINSRIPCLALFRSGCVEDLRRVILRILNDDTARGDLMNGCARYKEIFSYDAVAKKTVELYEEVLGVNRTY